MVSKNHRNNIDIECVLLCFLCKKIVSTKWRISIWLVPIFCRECELFFQQSLQKNIILYRDLKWKISFVKEIIILKTHRGFFKKSDSSEQDIYRYHRLNYSFKVVKTKTKHKRLRQTQYVCTF